MDIQTDEEKAKRVDETRVMAQCFAEDMQHIRELLAGDFPSRAAVRHLSGVMRRLLIDNGGDLRKISPPRIGKLTLEIADLLPIYRSDRKSPILLYCGGAVQINGTIFRSIMVSHGAEQRALPDYDPAKRVSLRLDNYLAQNVIGFKGQWLNRRDVIKYVANVAGGVHLGIPKETSEALLDRIRHVITIPIKDNVPHIIVNDELFNDVGKPLVVNPKEIDIALFQLLACAGELAASPDIKRLEAEIAAE